MHLVECSHIENNWKFRILSRFCLSAGGGGSGLWPQGQETKIIRKKHEGELKKGN